MMMKRAHVKHHSSTYRPTILGSTRRLAGGPVKELSSHQHDFVLVSSLINFDWRNEPY